LLAGRPAVPSVRVRARSASDGCTANPALIRDRRSSGPARRRLERPNSHCESLLRLGTLRPGWRRPAFSMAEMMIAIVILGLGMLMAATMFPIGWLRARDLSDFTNSSAAADTAATTVQLLTHVGALDGRDSSFLGDLDLDDADPTDSNIRTHSQTDTSVHVLHVENVLFETSDIWPEAILSDADLRNLFSANFIDLDGTMLNWAPIPPEAQIAFHERVFPALPPYPNNDESKWQEQLAGRRFAWAALHRLEENPTSADQPRSIVVYLVTLRRAQSTHRFARQDPQSTPAEPRALGRREDLIFPAPWLVRLTIAGNWDAVGNPRDPLGVPSEATANRIAGSNGELIARLLMTGSVLIDRVVGHVYRVKQQRFTGSGADYDRYATLTLDREINVEDVGVAPGGTVQIGVDDLRDFWVFPPPVVRGGQGADEAYPVFDGQQPVVAIETRQMVFSP